MTAFAIAPSGELPKIARGFPVVRERQLLAGLDFVADSLVAWRPAVGVRPLMKAQLTSPVSG